MYSIRFVLTYRVASVTQFLVLVKSLFSEACFKTGAVNLTHLSAQVLVLLCCESYRVTQCLSTLLIHLLRLTMLPVADVAGVSYRVTCLAVNPSLYAS